jgi:hypothetical protein
MQSLELMKIHDWTKGMPRKPMLADFSTLEGSVVVPAKDVPSEYMDRYIHKMKTHCKREDKFEVDMQLCNTVVHGQCTDDMLHEMKCQKRRMNQLRVDLIQLDYSSCYNEYHTTIKYRTSH